MNVIDDEKKFDMKRKMLRLLSEESGHDKKAVREFKLSSCAASAQYELTQEEVRRSLDALAGDGYATHDYDELNGIVWRITDSGLSAVSDAGKVK
ncbi:MAG TPA: hypothetical protein PLZ74_01720 [Kiritimatiellia bacterium]|jgi:hypothetical protein|nr:hypothetical protein [Kiritimatiellia bacterium]